MYVKKENQKKNLPLQYKSIGGGDRYELSIKKLSMKSMLSQLSIKTYPSNECFVSCQSKINASSAVNHCLLSRQSIQPVNQITPRTNRKTTGKEYKSRHQIQNSSFQARGWLCIDVMFVRRSLRERAICFGINEKSIRMMFLTNLLLNIRASSVQRPFGMKPI